MSNSKVGTVCRKRSFKVLLVVLCVILAGAAGLIWGYLPAHNYIRFNNHAYAVDAFFGDGTFEKSEYFAKQIVSKDFEAAEKCFKRQYSEGKVKELLNNLPFACKGQIDGTSAASDGYYADNTIRVDVADNISGTLSGCFHPEGGKSLYIGSAEYIEISYTRDQIHHLSQYWYEMRKNVFIVFWSELLLLVAGIALLAVSCLCFGEDEDGNAVRSNIFKIPFEITVAVILIAGNYAAYFGLGLLPNVDELCVTASGKPIYMAACCGLFAVFFMSLWFLIVSYAVSRKNHRTAKRSIICLVIMLLWKLLKIVGKGLKRFAITVKEIFTAEIYTGKTVARKMIWLDSTIIAVTAIIIVVVAVVANNVSGEAVAITQVCAIAAEAVALVLFLLGRYIIIRDEAQVEKQVREIYNGNYDYTPELAKNSPYAEVSAMLGEFSEQYRRGIEESVKAERMKIDLVTNVSHDLKTPLTSIIGYIELLSKQQLSEEATEYVDILKSKSERLKNIVSDVFELAKTTSGEITVEREPLDLTRLSYQTLGEMEDKITSSGFDIKVNICEPPVTVISDGKRLYRIIQNLLDNALKYSLKGTRIYYSLAVRDGVAEIVVKNIAAYEMTFSKEEILERFTRGDKARSSEGSGLGLSIAQGFTLACGGQFDIDIDGDMFKAIVTFPVARVAAEPKEAVTANE